MHYKSIDKIHPVFIGQEFWFRITGFPDFYDGLVSALHECINNLDTQNLIEEGCDKLALEISLSPIFTFDN